MESDEQPTDALPAGGGPSDIPPPPAAAAAGLLRGWSSGGTSADGSTNPDNSDEALILRDFKIHENEDDEDHKLNHNVDAMNKLLLSSAVPRTAPSKLDKYNNNPYAASHVNRLSKKSSTSNKKHGMFGSKGDIGVCLYGPSRVYLAGMLSRQAQELAKVTAKEVVAKKKTKSGDKVSPPPPPLPLVGEPTATTEATADASTSITSDEPKEQSQQKSESSRPLPQSRPEQDQQQQQQEEATQNNEQEGCDGTTTLTTVASVDSTMDDDPRWTDRDGWPRLAPRYEHGLQDVGSLTNKKRAETATTATDPKSIVAAATANKRNAIDEATDSDTAPSADSSRSPTSDITADITTTAAIATAPLTDLNDKIAAADAVAAATAAKHDEETESSKPKSKKDHNADETKTGTTGVETLSPTSMAKQEQDQLLPTGSILPVKQSTERTSSVLSTESMGSDIEQLDKPSHVIDINTLRRLSSQGISDKGGHRPVAWRVLLGYLPIQTSEWESVLKENRTLYRNLVGELFVKPTSDLMKQAKAAERHYQETGEKLQLTPSKSGGESGGRPRIDAAAGPSPIPHIPQHDGFVGLVPARIREQWKAEGRQQVLESHVNNHMTSVARRGSGSMMSSSQQLPQDSASSPMKQQQSSSSTNGKENGHNHDNNDDDDEEEMNYATSHVNALLVVDDDGYTPEDLAKQQRQRQQSKARQNGSSSPPSTPSSSSRKTMKGQQDIFERRSNTSRSPSKQAVVDMITSPSKRDLEHSASEEEILEYKWNQFFENAALLDEIRKDVVRTHPDLHFFLEPEQNLGQRRYAALERILFVWAKLNRGVRYVQGMNEIVGTIYFVLANDPNEEWAAEAEADTYALFNILMMEIRDVFVPDLDEADTGIQGRIANMMQLLAMHDPEVKCHLTDVGIDASFYSIRWLTTLLSREFTLPDTIRLWDSMFASTHKDNFLRYVCCTMVMMIRHQLLEGDFSICLRLLQQYPPTNVDRMLESSRALWIYESQITLACHRGGISLSQALSSIDPPPGVIMAYGLKGGRAESPGKKVERGIQYATNAAEETASTIASTGRKFFGQMAAQGGSLVKGWAQKRNDRKAAQQQHAAATAAALAASQQRQQQQQGDGIEHTNTHLHDHCPDEMEEQMLLKQEALMIARRSEAGEGEENEHQR